LLKEGVVEKVKNQYAIGIASHWFDYYFVTMLLQLVLLCC